MDKLGLKDIIDNGYCIGCGNCAYLSSETIAIGLNEYGQFHAQLLGQDIDTKTIDKFCPFSDAAKNEDELGNSLFPENKYVDTLGYIHSTYAGYVKEGDYRLSGSSGGFGSWFCTEMLRLGKVDAIIHATSSSSDKLFFEYGISGTVQEILANAKSKYYPMKLDQVLDYVKQREGKYLFVGIPCMVKAIRLLAERDSQLASSIVYTLGLVCGHIKSKAFSEMLAWQLGVKPRDLKSIDFRTKLEGYGANQYGVTVSKEECNQLESYVSPPVNELFGTNWGLGYFKSKACDFCDDVTAETADITIGDAWLPEYVNDYAGTNVLIVRNPLINDLLQDAVNGGRIHIENLDSEKVIVSQKSGINHRRKGLQYRLYLNEQNNKQSPKKRVAPSNNFPAKFKKVQELRIQLRDESHQAFFEAKQRDNWHIFVKKMSVLNQKYAALYRTPVHRRIINKLKRMLS